jgi:hypothetical protein
MASFAIRFSKKDAKGKGKVNPVPPLPPPLSGVAGLSAMPLNVSVPGRSPQGGKGSAAYGQAGDGGNRPKCHRIVPNNSMCFFFLCLVFLKFSITLFNFVYKHEGSSKAEDQSRELIPVTTNPPNVWEGFMSPVIQFKHGVFF